MEGRREGSWKRGVLDGKELQERGAKGRVGKGNWRRRKGSWKGGELDGRINGGECRRAGKEQEGRKSGWELNGKKAEAEGSWKGRAGGENSCRVGEGNCRGKRGTGWQGS